MIDINSPIFPMVNSLFEEDCLDCMKRIPDGTIDMILCDLPYGITQNQWDSYIPLDLLWKQYWRIIKPNGAVVLTSQGLFTANLILNEQDQLNNTKSKTLVVVDVRGSETLQDWICNAERIPLDRVLISKFVLMLFYFVIKHKQ